MSENTKHICVCIFVIKVVFKPGTMDYKSKAPTTLKSPLGSKTNLIISLILM